ncbi:tyrosine-type recombinase/integrase [Paenibacillus elgii]|uniref:tyrosine-type recombinase/integrase n=1 Tax=Paenibacillus elgii TaxID=189691 RepID=UPI000248D795|nr:tyrosine-type recombinase/integrase [Paenibacillus elgii]
MIELYLSKLAARGKSEATIKNYKSQLYLFLDWLEKTTGSRDPLSITSTDAVEYRRYLQQNGAKPGPINTKLATIKAFCAWLHKEGHLTHNPVADVEKVAMTAPPIKWLDKNEAHRVKRSAEHEKNIRNKTIIWTLLFAGLRVSELCDLEPEDIITTERSGEIIVRQGKGNKYREVPIPKVLRECLNQYIDANRDTMGEYLFDSQREERITPRAVQHLCDKIGKNAKLGRRLTPHMLRHTFGHDLVKRGVSLHIVMKLMGHASLEATKIYLEPGKDELQEAVELLNDR